MTEVKIYISILNWNAASDTIRCIKSLLDSTSLDNLKIEIGVIDNASSPSDYLTLESNLINKKIKLIRNEENLGFAGGHNILMKEALINAFDYIWVLNNDTIVLKNTLSELIKTMQREPQCGACSPVIKRLGSADIVDYCGSTHNWKALSISHPANISEAPGFCEKNSNDLWLVGTALFLRATALNEIGLFNEKLFAYYEDNDMGVRLNNAGWTNRLVFESHIEHACFDGVITDRKPYYFYLMARNSFLFFLNHTPTKHRKLLRMRLTDNSLVVAENLDRMGYSDKATACLLGIADGLAGVGGPPVLDRRVPFWLQCLRPLGRWWNRKRA